MTLSDSIRSQGFADGLFFPQPEPLITGPATRVMSLRDGTKKMSKSDASDNSRINLTDDADTIAQKIRKAKTDPEPLPSEEKGLETRPEADNLVGIYAALSGVSKASVLTEFGGGQFSSFKNALVELCVAKLSPIAAEMKRLVADPGHVDGNPDRRRRKSARPRRRDHAHDQGHRRVHPAAVTAPPSERNCARPGTERHRLQTTVHQAFAPAQRRRHPSTPRASLSQSGSECGSMHRFGSAPGHA